MGFVGRLVMGGLGLRRAAKPGQHRLSLDPSRLAGEQGGVGGVGPLSKIVDQAVLLLILVDVDDQLLEIRIGVNPNALEGVFE